MQAMEGVMKNRHLRRWRKNSQADDARPDDENDDEEMNKLEAER